MVPSLRFGIRFAQLLKIQLLMGLTRVGRSCRMCAFRTHRYMGVCKVGLTYGPAHSQRSSEHVVTLDYLTALSQVRTGTRLSIRSTRSLVQLPTVDSHKHPHTLP